MERSEEKNPATEGLAETLRGVWVVVLTWNGWEFAEACLDSLRPAAGRGATILVVDNGSTDGTPQRVRERFPEYRLIENGANLGFAGGNNVGMRCALDAGAEFVVLLNQDATIAPDCVDELLAAAGRHPEAGTVSAKIYFHDRPEVLWFAGATFSTLTGRTRDIGSGRRDEGQFDREAAIQRGTACTMLITRRFLEAVGLFDDELFLYGEEMDLSLRARGSGLVNLFAPRARAWHRVSTSTGGAASGEYLYYHTRNMLYLLNRHLPIRRRSVSALRNAVVILVMVASIATMRPSPVSSVRAVLAGARDFARRRMGERPTAASRAAATHSA